MQASLDGLGQLLNMLLDVSRLDANAVQVERSPTSAQRLLEDLNQDFHQLAAEKGLRLHVCSSRLWVHTDPTVLRRILGNLLSNAVRYTSRGRVLIGCRLRGPEVEFQVWDSGIGIPPEQREAIFEEFRDKKIKFAKMPFGSTGGSSGEMGAGEDADEEMMAMAAAMDA